MGERCVCETDLVNFTKWCGHMPNPEEIYKKMEQYNCHIDELIKLHGSMVEKIELVGDSVLLISVNVADMVSLCLSFLKMFTRIRPTIFNDFIDVRMGIHVGDVYQGYIGGHKRVYGQTVNIASRLEQLGIPGTIHISEIAYSRLSQDERYSIGKNRLNNLKGIGNLNSLTLFSKLENSMIVEDNTLHMMILAHIVNKQNNTTSVEVEGVFQCFEILKKQYFENVVVLDRFFQDADAFEKLREFRVWEREHRSEVQKFILISGDEISTELIDDVFVLKDENFVVNFRTALMSMNA